MRKCVSYLRRQQLLEMHQKIDDRVLGVAGEQYPELRYEDSRSLKE